MRAIWGCSRRAAPPIDPLNRPPPPHRGWTRAYRVCSGCRRAGSSVGQPAIKSTPAPAPRTRRCPTTTARNARSSPPRTASSRQCARFRRRAVHGQRRAVARLFISLRRRALAPLAWLTRLRRGAQSRAPGLRPGPLQGRLFACFRRYGRPTPSCADLIRASTGCVRPRQLSLTRRHARTRSARPCGNSASRRPFARPNAASLSRLRNAVHRTVGRGHASLKGHERGIQSCASPKSFERGKYVHANEAPPPAPGGEGGRTRRLCLRFPPPFHVVRKVHRHLHLRSPSTFFRGRGTGRRGSVFNPKCAPYPA